MTLYLNNWARPAITSHTSSRVFSISLGWSISQTPAVASLQLPPAGQPLPAAFTPPVTLDLDLSAIAATAHDLAVSDEHLVFYNNPATPDGSVGHTGDNRTGGGSAESIIVDLDALERCGAAKVVLLASIYFDKDEPQVDQFGRATKHFGMVQGARVTVCEPSGVEVFSSELTHRAAGDTAVRLGEVYRDTYSPKWYFKPIGDGHTNGFAGMLQEYGIRVR